MTIFYLLFLLGNFALGRLKLTILSPPEIEFTSKELLLRLVGKMGIFMKALSLHPKL
jgi:hypothetical protein